MTIEENIDEIVQLIKKAKRHDGYKMSPSADIELQKIRGKLIELSNGEVDIHFEKHNSNMRIGMYKITLVCVKEIEEFIYQNW